MQIYIMHLKAISFLQALLKIIFKQIRTSSVCMKGKNMDKNELLEEQEFIIWKNLKNSKQHIVNSLRMLILAFILMNSMKQMKLNTNIEHHSNYAVVFFMSKKSRIMRFDKVDVSFLSHSFLYNTVKVVTICAAVAQRKYQMSFSKI